MITSKDSFPYHWWGIMLLIALIVGGAVGYRFGAAVGYRFGHDQAMREVMQAIITAAANKK